MKELQEMTTNVSVNLNIHGPPLWMILLMRAAALAIARFIRRSKRKAGQKAA